MTEYALPAQLARRAGLGELAHAYILAGRDREAVDGLAVTLAQAMVCTAAGNRPCGECRGCRKTRDGIHPDVIRMAPEEGKDFTVGQARALRSDAYVTPNEAPRKVYILQDAQRMNIQAQNALLKVLEEGPRYAAFLLLTDNASALLPTIRSRCEVVNVGGEEAESGKTRVLAEELAQALLGDDRWAMAAKCVPLEKGKREETVALWEATRGVLTALATGKKRARAAMLAKGLGELIVQAGQNVNMGALWGKLYALAG